MNLKYIITGVVILAVVIVGTTAVFLTNSKNGFETIRVNKETVQRELVVSGTVVPAKTIELSFEQAGKVVLLQTTEGEMVSSGQELARLDDTELRSSLIKAQATLASTIAAREQQRALRDTELAKLDELRRGARPEEISLAQTKVSNAEKALADAQLDLANTKSKATVDLNNLYADIDNLINDAFIKADNAINQKIDALFIDDNTDDPELSFNTTDNAFAEQIELDRIGMRATIDRLRDRANSVPTAHGSLDGAINDTESDLKAVRSFLNDVTASVNNAIGLSQSTLDGYHTDINSARTNINSALTNLSNQEQAIAGQKVSNQSSITTKELAVTTSDSTYLVAQGELNLLLAGATSEELRAQEARVSQADRAITSQQALTEQAQAEIQSINTLLDQLILVSPITGTVTNVAIETGEVVTSQTIIVTIISDASLHVEADIPEISFADIVVGLEGTITLDAYGPGVTFPSRVTMIDPAETIVDGTPTYTTTYAFGAPDDRIKPGMTATITMITDQHENALVLPQYVLLPSASGYEVEIVNTDHSTTKRAVTLGLRGNNGLIEITSGVSEGEMVVIPESN